MRTPSTIEAGNQKIAAGAKKLRPAWKTPESTHRLERNQDKLRSAGENRGRWLIGVWSLLLSLLMQLPVQAQTFCAPDATGYYSFERTFNDRSSYDDYYTGGLEGAQNTTNVPTFSTIAKVGAYSASFNGTNQYLSYASTSGYMRNGGHSLSLMFWFKANLPGSGDQVMFEQGDATNGISIRLNNATGQLQARVRTAGTTIDLTGSNISDTDWHHVAFTYTYATTPSNLYLDGTLVDSDTPSQLMGTSGSGAGLGAAQGNNVWNTSTAITQYFNGFIDDFVYSVDQDVINVRGSGGSVYTETEINNYITCVNGFATNKFTCNGGNFNVIYPTTGSRGSDLLQFDYASNSFSTVDGTGTLGYNALGYNQVDNYLYAIGYGGSSEEDWTNRNNTLLRIGADGTIEDLGFIVGMSASATASYNSADISPSGIMYVTNSNLGGFYAINLNVKPYTATAISMPVLYVGDWAYNPADGYLYGVSLIGTVIKINATTGARVVVNPTNGQLPADNYASVWFDQFNNLYAMGARLVRYSLGTNSWSTVLRNAPVPSSGSSDGAACPVTSADPAITKTIFAQSGNTVTFDLTLFNNGPAPVADLNVRDVLPTGLVFQSAQVLDASGVELDATDYTLTNPVVNANGTVLLKLNDLSVGTANRVVLRLTVKAAAGVCNQTINNCAEIISAFGQTASNGTLGNTADNTTTIPGDVASNNESCAPVSFSLSSAAPTASTSSLSVCSGDQVAITYTTSPAGQQVAWQRLPDGLTGTGNITNFVSNTTTAPLSYTYAAWVVGTASGCNSATTTTTLTVNLRPVVIPSQCSQTICVGQTGSITFTSSVSATVNWLRVQDGATGTGNISEVFTTPGTYTYKVWGVSTGASCPSSTTITCEIVVNEGITVTAGTPVCDPGNTTYAVSVTATGATSLTASAGTVSGTGSEYTISGIPAGTDVILTPAGSCSATSYTVTAPNCCVTLPVPTASVTTQPNCTTPTATITVSAPLTGVTYSFDGGLTFQTSNVKSGLAANTNYTILVKDNTTGCLSDALPLTVNAVSNLRATASSNSPVCTGSPLQLFATSTGSTGTVTYSWSGPDGFASTLQNPGIPAPTAVAGGVYTVTVSDPTCSTTASTTVTIASQPDLALSGTPGLTVCSGQSTVLTVTGDNGATVSWTNTLGQTGTGTSINFGGLLNVSGQPQTITYYLTASAGGCSDEASATIIINPAPFLQVVPARAVICALELTNIVATASSPTATLNWTRTPTTPNPPPDSGTGTGNLPINQSLPAGTYTYTITATENGCSSSPVVVPITVNN